jgi:hypothetical protein
MTEDITHPNFLIRANWSEDRWADHKAAWRNLKPLCPPIEEPAVTQAEHKSRLTASLKDRIAADVMAAIADGHDTFGKLRKKLAYTDRELKAGIRHGRKWQLRATNTGTKAKPNLAQFYTRIDNAEGSTRVYTVVRKGA